VIFPCHVPLAFPDDDQKDQADLTQRLLAAGVAPAIAHRITGAAIAARIRALWDCMPGAECIPDGGYPPGVGQSPGVHRCISARVGDP
jgi:hypothetical protein